MERQKWEEPEKQKSPFKSYLPILNTVAHTPILKVILAKGGLTSVHKKPNKKLNWMLTNLGASRIGHV
jgi:hypothetical protein